MIEYFGDPQMFIRGAIAGGAGSFLRESALLYSRLEKQQTGRVLLFAFLPLWVTCGAVLGAVVGPSDEMKAIYVLMMGAAWRKIATDGGSGLKIVRKVLNEMDSKAGENANRPALAAAGPVTQTPPDPETAGGDGDKA
jgi:hypothetical protein